MAESPAQPVGLCDPPALWARLTFTVDGDSITLTLDDDLSGSNRTRGVTDEAG